MTNSLPETPNSLTGGCRCGAVRYRISEKPVAAGLCHCNRCRPQSGSAFSTVIIIKRSTFQIEGETTVFEDVGASGLHVGRRGCARCGSPLTTEPDVTPDIMFVKAGGIDGWCAELLQSADCHRHASPDGHHVCESRRHRQQRMVSTDHGVVRHSPQTMGDPGPRHPAIRWQSSNLRECFCEPTK
jgi:hypothetical protein